VVLNYDKISGAIVTIKLTASSVLCNYIFWYFP